ncbi:hypothetical protein [Vibrio paucivorans]|uniref:Lipoprotein n=1 Tax=Vibrio paucivorans TaxID=2829489 RepID=A0A9X3CH94_9VIBR|nr:hypothetical protein [Vibrio paucivorans]MCW8335797.1 hypothetical protein [Vibrio paucivorans]
MVKGFIFAVLVLMLQGCEREKLERIADADTYEFSGLYTNQYNQDTLTFKDGYVSFETRGVLVSRSYRVDDGHVLIKFANNSKEKREDLVMRIHGNGELLTCSACAKYNMMNIWVKELYLSESP